MSSYMAIYVPYIWHIKSDPPNDANEDSDSIFAPNLMGNNERKTRRDETARTHKEEKKVLNKKQNGVLSVCVCVFSVFSAFV